MKRKSLLATVPWLVLVAGCSMNPRLVIPPAPVAANYPGATMADGARAAPIEWRQMFGDPRLQRLIGLALIDNRDLRIAVLQAAEARGQLRIARGAQLPAVGLEGGYTRQRAPAAVADAGVGIGAGQGTPTGVEFGQFTAQAALTSFEIDLFGRLRSQSQAAFERYLASEEGARASRLAVIGAVADSYFAERLADEQLRLTEATLADWRASLDLTRELHGAAQVGGAELAQAEGLVRQGEADLEQRRRERDQAGNALVLAVGAPLPADLPAPIGLSAQPVQTQLAAGLPSELLLRRPDILQTEHELRAANYDVGAARAAFFPRLSLTGMFGFSSLALDELFKGASQSWSFSPQVTMPLLQGQAPGALAAAKARRSIAVANYERTIQSAFREVADGLAARATYDKQRQAQTAAVDLALRRLRLTDQRYRAGLDSRLDLLDAQRSSYAARQILLEVKRAELSSAVALYRALAGGAGGS